VILGKFWSRFDLRQRRDRKFLGDDHGCLSEQTVPPQNYGTWCAGGSYMPPQNYGTWCPAGTYLPLQNYGTWCRVSVGLQRESGEIRKFTERDRARRGTYPCIITEHDRARRGTYPPRITEHEAPGRQGVPTYPLGIAERWHRNL
jgi:hypothetical protein